MINGSDLISDKIALRGCREIRDVETWRIPLLASGTRRLQAVVQMNERSHEE
jgi:hypothetical protein